MIEITDKLINERLERLGFGDKQANDEDARRESVLKHYHIKLTENCQDGDFNIYEESTADGYSVWIATADDKSINVSEDVYYYESDLGDILYEAIPDYNNIYCDNYDFVEDAITRHYEDLLFRIEEEVVDELLDEGYNHKIVTPINALQYIEMISQDDQFTGAKEIYDGFINITVDHEYKWLNYATQIIKDKDRYEIIANHYGLTIEHAVKGELIFKELKDEN